MAKRQETLSPTEKIAYVALLVAMQVILGNLIQIPLQIKQFNFGFLPIAVAGALFGAPAAMIVGGLGDFFGAHLFPAGAYFYGFTITSALVGLLYGLILYRQKHSWPRIIAACLAVSVCNLFLNSYWLTYFIPKSYWVLVGSRSLMYLIDIPIFIVVIYFTMKGLSRIKTPAFAKIRGDGQAAREAAKTGSDHEQREETENQ